MTQRVWLDRITYLSPRLVWVAPLAGVVLYAVPGIVLLAAARLVRHPALLPFGVTLLSVLFWLNGLMLVGKLHLLAQASLACGLATLTGFAFERHAVRCLAVARKVLWTLVALVVLSFLAQQAAAWKAVSPPVQPARPHAPNVLLIVLDTVRSDALGLYGSPRNTSPHLDRFARRGVVFEQAMSTAPWTLPSMAGMFTGRLPSQLSADWQSPLDARCPTLAERLRDHGYATAGFVANTAYCSAETGLARGFGHYEDYSLSWVEWVRSLAIGRQALIDPWLPRLGYYDDPGRTPAAEINVRFLRWLERNGERPFFAFLNYSDAHDPYVAPPPFNRHPPVGDFDRIARRLWWPISKDGIDRGDVAQARRAYEDCIRYLDQQLGRLFEQFDRRGLLDETVVVITSDHGEHFGEHGLLLHGNSLYQPLLHVPLIVVGPDRVPQGRRVETPVSLRNLPTTVLELAGVAEGGPSPFPGRPLSRCWRPGAADDETEPEPVIAELTAQSPCPPCRGRSPVGRGPMVAIRRGPWKYIRTGTGEELYHLRSDPQEQHSLDGVDTYRDALQSLRTLLSRTPP